MPTEATAPDGSTQAAEQSDPPAGASTTSQDEGADGATSITDVSVLQKELARARKDAAKYRTDLKVLTDAKAEEDKAAESESQRLTRRNTELEAALAKAVVDRDLAVLEAAVSKAAIDLGIVDADAAVRLLDTSELETDDETGRPKNVDAALKALIKEKPYLAKQPEVQTPGSINGASGTQAGPAPTLTTDELAAAQAAGMTPERYAALKGVKTLDDWTKAQPPKQ